MIFKTNSSKVISQDKIGYEITEQLFQALRMMKVNLMTLALRVILRRRRWSRSPQRKVQRR